MYDVLYVFAHLFILQNGIFSMIEEKKVWKHAIEKSSLYRYLMCCIMWQVCWWHFGQLFAKLLLQLEPIIKLFKDFANPDFSAIV